MKRFLYITITVFALTIVWLVFGKNQFERNKFYKFDHESWAVADRPDRYFMAKYLVDNQILNGKTKDEVFELLGDANQSNEGMLLYNLGSERSTIFPIDDDWLEISFDGRTLDSLTVKNTRIRPD